MADVGVVETRLILHLKVANLTAVQVADDDVALRSIRIDGHLARLRDMGITILAQHHLYLKVVKGMGSPCDTATQHRHKQKDEQPQVAHRHHSMGVVRL